jgi:hypothetical protein
MLCPHWRTVRHDDVDEHDIGRVLSPTMKVNWPGTEFLRDVIGHGFELNLDEEGADTQTSLKG